MIGSLSHLANVGLAAYIQDMIEAEKKLKNTYTREIKVSPLPPAINTPAQWYGPFVKMEIGKNLGW
jgi:hypothetical protein